MNEKSLADVFLFSEECNVNAVNASYILKLLSEEKHEKTESSVAKLA